MIQEHADDRHNWMTVYGKFGWCDMRDCLKVMPKIEELFDLVWADPPWGQEYDGTKPTGINQQATKQDRVNYDDKWDPEFHRKWFTQAQRISKAQIIAVGGDKHLDFWRSLPGFLGMFVLCVRNSQGMRTTAVHSGVCYYVCYYSEGHRDWWKQHKFFREWLKVEYKFLESEPLEREELIHEWREDYIRNGFLRDGSKDHTYKHPSPKPFETWRDLIRDLHPASVYDPFMGSGTVGEVCEYLGITWGGCELDADGEYLADIQYRIRRGQERREAQQKGGPLKRYM